MSERVLHVETRATPMSRYRLTKDRQNGLFLCLAVVGITAALCHTAPLGWLESRLYDTQVRLVARWRVPSPRIVIVGIDDESLDLLAPQVGRWPWPRVVLASLLDYCSEADVVGVDLLFAEQDYVFQGSDDHLADAVAAHGRVVCAAYVADSGPPRALPVAASASALPGLDLGNLTKTTHGNALLPYPALLEAAAALGIITQTVDRDGTVRRYSLAEVLQGSTYPSFAVALALAALRIDRHAVKLGPGRRCQLGSECSVRLDREGQFLLSPSGRPYQTVSAAAVFQAIKDEIEGRRPPLRRQQFAGKIVIIASTATGVQKDSITTSTAPIVAGAYVHATALDNLLARATLQTPPAWGALLLALLLVVPLLLSPIERPLSVLSGHVLLAVLYFGVSVLVLVAAGVVMPLAIPLLSLLSCGVATGTRSWRRENVQRLALERLEVAKQRFTDMLVHDLRNRITPLVLVFDLLRDRVSADDSESQGLLTTGSVSAQRLLTEMQSLLDIRKMSEGRLRINPRALCVEDFLGENLPLYEPAFAERHCCLQRAHGSPHLAAWADPAITARILGNLIWNALDHGQPNTKIEIGCDQLGEQVRVWVANRGTVITGKDREAVFVPYVSLAMAGGKRSSGTGLGLTFCKVAAEAHGGTIDIESPWCPYGDGVKVVVLLPLAGAHGGRSDGAGPPPD